MGSLFGSINPGAEEGMKAYMAPSLFQPHNARQAIRDAHEKKIPPLIGYYAGLSSIPITRYLAPMGYDVVWIDWEHTSCNVETMTTVRQTLYRELFVVREKQWLTVVAKDGPRSHVHERWAHHSFR